MRDYYENLEVYQLAAKAQSARRTSAKRSAASPKGTHDAFTLIELIMVIVIVGVLTAASSMYIKETMDLWRFLSFRNEVVSQVRLALIRMQREIRLVKDDLSVLTATASRFRFIDLHDNTIDYQLSGSNLMRNSDILAANVTSLTFTYYNNTNTLISTPLVSPNLTDIYRIGITLVIWSGNQTKTLFSQVYPRNL